ncbi:GNAT family N-acetyltransferase [Planctomycetota bacterium]|nr:GNAT family N-acetyltransferase [Planctomycetota bacterium]
MREKHELIGQAITANEAHLDEIIEMAISLWPPCSDTELTTREAFLQEFIEILQKKDQQLFVYLINSKAVGFFHVAIRRDYVEGSVNAYGIGVGYGEGLYVKEAYRGIGIARALTDAGEKWAKVKGCKRMAADSELGNELGIACLKGIGYKEVNRVVCFIRDL